jgi:hypothetical protein
LTLRCQPPPRLAFASGTKPYPIRKMPDTGHTVPGMTEPARRYHVTITVDRGGGQLPNPAEFAAAAGQAASARAASIVSAHTAGQIISVVTIQAADQPAVVVIALAVVSEALAGVGKLGSGGDRGCGPAEQVVVLDGQAGDVRRRS